MKTNPSDLPAKLAQYRELEYWIRDYSQKHYPRGTVVWLHGWVNPRFAVVAETSQDVGYVCVVFNEFGSRITVALQHIRPITPEERERLPEWVLRVEKEVKND